MGKLFGTDGVRGVAGVQLTSKLAHQLGYAATLRFRNDNEGKVPIFVIGTDTRISCDMLYSAFVSGVLAAGGKVLNAGVITTPAVAVLVREFGADMGVVISASHNSYEYNGIKFFDSQGYKLPDEVEDEIEKLIFEKVKSRHAVEGAEIGTSEEIKDAGAIYKKYILDKLNLDSLEGMKIVLDTANGASYIVAPEIFMELGAEVSSIHCEPDGININKDCGSTHIDSLKDEVIRVGADIGIAYDGDGDRLICVDENGGVFDGDKIMYTLANDLKQEGKLAQNTLVITVMSNLGLKQALNAADIEISETTVGDRYVVERMKEEGYNIGGEQSGHIICLDINSTGDGIMSSLMVCKVMKETGEKLSELGNKVNILPQVLINAKVDNAKKFDYKKDKRIIEKIESLEKKYDGSGRVLIRTSGTEPLVRVMIEGEDADIIQKDARELADYIMEILA